MPLTKLHSNRDAVDLVELQKKFLADGGLTLAQDVFHHLNHVGFFVKDRQSRFILVSPSLARCLGGASCLEFVHKNDHDYFLPEVAEAYSHDDRRVVAEGSPIRQKQETLAPLCGEPRPVITTKYPVIGNDEEIIGVAGIIRCGMSETERDAPPLERSSLISAIVTHASSHPQHRLGGHAIAALVGQPLDQVRKILQERMDCGPRELYQLILFRMMCKELASTTEPVGEIGQKFGYRSASAFTARFRELSGETPTQFRQRWLPGLADN